MSNVEAEILKKLEVVTDPEIPVLSIVDLGIVRDIKISKQVNGDEITIKITPTYSGCPAMDVISMSIRLALANSGYKKITIENQISPAWTTDWMTETGKHKLKEYGIAPPKRKSVTELGLFEEDELPCPKCNSINTEIISRFGPTSCKALYKCNDCKEPFEHFKCH